MNKRLLYGGATISFIALLTYFNLTNIANWWVARKDAQELKGNAEKNDTLPYFKNQFIVRMPNDSKQKKELVDKLSGYGLKKVHSCSCSDDMDLWSADPNLADLLVKLAPDHDPPEPPPTQSRQLDGNKKGKVDTTSIPPIYTYYYSITRNYKIVEPVSLTKVVRHFKPSEKRYPTYKSQNPKVIVATIDTGVDPTVPGVNSVLYQNTSSTLICQAPTVEGTYGWNILNRTNVASDREPMDEDEKCYDIFSVRRGHGTLINGIIAGMGWYPNQTDFTNDPQVNISLLNVKFVDQRANMGSLFDAICAINYALDKGAKVINASWRLPLRGVDTPSVKATFAGTLAKLKSKDATLVTCAGNDTRQSDPNLRIWPASFSRDIYYGNHVISVGGWNTNQDAQNISPTSNIANFVDVYAPSMGIRMYNRIGSVPFWKCPFMFDRPQDGTSFATPFITRQVAILKGTTGKTSAEIKAAIILQSPLTPSGTTSVHVTLPNM